ncbi:Cilia- and flagella-associated protein 99 [Diplonema papillatum]|nr:Cilia- and flagella-associated protein 99 [Diplonema papillatum]
MSLADSTQGQLWDVCERCIKTFNPATHSVDSHASDFLEKERKASAIDGESEDFMRQVLYGTTRYRKVLECAVNKYSSAMRRMTDCFTSLLLIAYLALFRLDELGSAGFRLLICSSPVSHSRMAEFLSFVFSPAHAEDIFAPVWRTMYDDEYVDRVLVGHIKEHEPTIDAVVQSFLSPVAAGRKGNGEGSSTRRAPGAGKEDRPRPKPDAKRAEPPRGHRGGAAPAAADTAADSQRPKRVVDGKTEETDQAIQLFKKGIQASSLSKAVAEENRKREQAIPAQPPVLLTALRKNEGPHEDAGSDQSGADHTRSPVPGIEEVRARLAKQPAETAKATYSAILREDAVHKRQQLATHQAEESERAPPKPVPVEEVRRRLQQAPDGEPPKLTTAALLREDAIFQKKQKGDEDELRRKEIELHDATRFNDWRSRMKDSDEAAEKERVAQRKIEMMLADEEAKMARVNEETRRARVAAGIKKSVEAELARKRAADEALLESNRAYAQKQTEVIQAAVLKAKTTMHEQRHAAAQQIKQEDRLIELQAAERLELELQRKAEVIAAIRERAAALRSFVDADGNVVKKQFFVREFDPEATAGTGSLYDMSLAELQGRLVEVRDEENRQRDLRRDQIEASREQAKQNNNAKLNEVLQRRAVRAQETMVGRLKKKKMATDRELEKESRDRLHLQSLQARLQEKREQRMAEEAARRQAERQRKLAQMLNAADGGAVEYKRWEEQEKGKRNISRNRQLKGIEAARQVRQLDERQQRQRETVADGTVSTLLHSRRQQDATARAAAEERKLRLAEEALALKSAAFAEFTNKQSQKQQRAANEALDAIDTL